MDKYTRDQREYLYKRYLKCLFANDEAGLLRLKLDFGFTDVDYREYVKDNRTDTDYGLGYL